MGSIPESGRSPEEGSGNPLQYSYLRNHMDWGACWAMVHSFRKSWTQVSFQRFSSPREVRLPETCFASLLNCTSESHSGALSCLAWLDGLRVPTGEPFARSRSLFRQVLEGFVGGRVWSMSFPVSMGYIQANPSILCWWPPFSCLRSKREIIPWSSSGTLALALMSE